MHRALRLTSKWLVSVSLPLLMVAALSGAGRIYCLGSCGPVVFPPIGGVTCGGSCLTNLCSCTLITYLDQFGNITGYSCDCN